MRGTRWLILLAIAAVLGGVAITYRMQRAALERQAPQRPKPLPQNLSASSEEFVWRQSFPGQARTWIEVRGKSMGQSRDNAQQYLDGVELRVYDKTRPQFNLIRCARAPS